MTNRKQRNFELHADLSINVSEGFGAVGLTQTSVPGFLVPPTESPTCMSTKRQRFEVTQTRFSSLREITFSETAGLGKVAQRQQPEHAYSGRGWCPAQL